MTPADGNGWARKWPGNKEQRMNKEIPNVHTRGPFYKHALILAQISNYTHYKVRDEITYPFPNFNGATAEVWEWISNFTPHFTRHVITYPCRDWRIFSTQEFGGMSPYLDIIGICVETDTAILKQGRGVFLISYTGKIHLYWWHESKYTDMFDLSHRHLYHYWRHKCLYDLTLVVPWYTAILVANSGKKYLGLGEFT